MSGTLLRRLWYRLDLYAALDHLRALFARDKSGRFDDKPRRALLELIPLDLRSPPSESIGTVGLPLAATAAGLAAAVYLSGALDASAAHAGEATAACLDAAGRAAGEYDTAAPDPVAAGAAGPAEPAGGGGPGAAGPSDAAAAPATRDGPVDDAPEDGWAAGGEFEDALGNRFAFSEGGTGSSGSAGGAGGSGESAPTPTTGSADPGTPGGASGATADAGMPVPAPAGPLARPRRPDGVAAPHATGGHATAGTGGGSTAGGGHARHAHRTDRVTFAGDAAATPTRFVANAGQWDPAVAFAAQGNGYQAQFSDAGVVLALPRPGTSAGAAFDQVRLTWAGADPAARAAGEGRLPSVSNFFLGADPAGWRTGVPEYSAVRYAGLWPGTDLVYRRADRTGLGYALTLAPGADPRAVGFSVAGATARVGRSGRLVLTTPSDARLAVSAPVLFQRAAGGGRQLVRGGYAVRPDGTVGFTVGAFDHARALVIDPTLSTLSAGSDSVSASGVRADGDGNVYVSGTVTEVGTGADAFAAKFDASGTLVWRTYLGGSGGTLGDAGSGLAVGSDGSVYLAGSTDTTNFPTTVGAYQTAAGGGTDAFLAKLTPTGSVVYATYLGGSGSDSGNGVAVDPATGEATVVGSTASTNFPTASAYRGSLSGSGDAFVTRLSAAGTGLVYSTYYGGSGADTANGVALDAAGRALVAGGNGSDATVSEWGATGSLVAAATFGGSGTDVANAVAVDSEDRVYVAGQTTSTDLPTVHAAQGSTGGGTDAFLAAYDGLAIGPAFATYLGGSGTDSATGVAVDGQRRAVVAGTTSSTNFPTAGPTQGSFGGGSTDVFVARYAADGSALNFSTYWGSSATEFGTGAAADTSGNVYASGGDGTHAVVLKYAAGPAAPAISGMTDDTGASNSDRITTDTTPTLSGTAPAGATVTVYRRGPADAAPVSAATATASGGGLWTFTYSPALADGVYAFTATAAVSGETSAASAPTTVTIDAAAPSVTLSVTTPTTEVAPQVVVAAGDLVGFAGTTTVTLDVDLNNDGDFADAGETAYAAAALANGRAVFTGYAALTPGTIVRMRARVTDLAGDEGASAATSIAVNASSSPWTVSAATPDSRSGYGGMVGWTTPADSFLYAADVTAREPLDLDASPSPVTGVEPDLVYNSQEANPAPVVQALLKSDNALALPSHVYGTLTWDGSVAGGTDYDLSGLSPGGTWAFAYAPASSLATGRHTYSFAFFVDYTGTTNDHRVTLTGDTFVVNRSAGPYGAGWSVAGVDALVPVTSTGTYPAGMLREFGGGGWAFYPTAGIGGTYTSPAGDGGSLLAVDSGGGDRPSGGGFETDGGGVGSTLWVYTAADGSVSTFDDSGALVSWASPDGAAVVTYTADVSGGLSTVASPDGGVATFTYSGGLLSAVAAPGSRVTTLSYSGSDLTGVVNPAGGTHTLSYSSHRLTCDADGAAKVSYAYDSHGLAAGYTLGADPTRSGGIGAGLAAGSETGPGGSVAATLTDALGYAWTNWYNPFGQPAQTLDPTGAVGQFTRDSNGFLTKYTDALGRATTFAVDAAGRVLGETRADGGLATWAYGGANGALTKYTDFRGGVWTYTNDANGFRLTQTDPLNHTTTYTWSSGLLQSVTDPAGDVTTYHYDAHRRPDGALSGGAVTGTVGYDSAGRPVSFTDPLSHVTTASYDGAGRVIGTVDALGDRTTSSYDAAGFLLWRSDPLGHTTSFAYDAAGRVVGVIGAYGTSAQRRVTLTYDAAEQLVAATDGLGRTTTQVLDPVGRVVASVDALGNRTTATYDLEGETTAVRDALGRVSTFAYDTLGRMAGATNALGQVGTVVYDANSNVVATVDALGDRTTAVYDAADRMTASVDPVGDRTTFGYDAADRLVSATDPLNHTTTAVYDARSRLSAVADAQGHRVTVGYDAADNPVTTTDPNNHVTTTVYDALNRAIASVDALGDRTTAVFDAAGNRVAGVDPLGHRTTLVYDELNRPIATVDALGNRSTAVYDAADQLTAAVDPLGHRTSVSYDAAGRVASVTDALGNRTTASYDVVGNLVGLRDALGNRTTTSYDALGRLVAVTDPLNHTWTSTYEAAGRLVASTDPLAHTTTAVYDAASRMIAVVDPLGDRTSFAYDAASNPVTTTDALGRVTTAVYDELNRQVATVDALANRSTWAYDAAGNMAASVDALNRRTTFGFDAANRWVTTTDALGNVWTTGYDAASNVVAATDPLNHTTTGVYDADNRVQAVVDPLADRTSYAYDAAGNLKTVTDARNNVTTFGYDARNMPVTTTDALGNVWTTQYDALGRAWRSIDPLGRDARTYFDPAGRPVESADGLGYRTDAVYDAAGNVVASVDPRGNRTSYGFDAANRWATTTDALGKVWTATYDAVGNVVTATDPLNHTTTAVYDALNRPTATIDALGNRSTAVYDAVGNTTALVDALNRRTTFGYDALNRVATTTDALGGVATTTFDAAGNVTAGVDQLGNRTTFGYDAADRLTTLTDPRGFTSTVGYDAVGNPVSFTDPLAHTTTFVYDAADRQTAAVNPLANRTTAVYDAAGQQIASVDQLGNRTSYAYDARGMQTSTTDPLGNVWTYAYDAAGNAVADATARGNVSTTVYDALNRAVATVDPLGNRATTTFDAAGNPTVLTDQLGYRTTVGYDAVNRPVTVTRPTGGVQTLAFDAVSNLVATTDPVGDTTTYGYDALNRQLTTTDPLGFVTTAVYDAASRQTGMTDASGNRTTWAFDAAGNVTSETDPLNHAATFAFDAAGRLASATDRLGRRIDYAYDATDNPSTQKWYNSGGSLTQTQTYTFDAANRLTGAADPSGAYTLAYDAASRVSSVQEPFGQVLTMGYDADGNRTSVQDSKGGYTTSTFDALDRLATRKETGNGGVLRFDYAYTARGDVSSLTRYSDLAGTSVVGTTAYQYDAGERLTNLKQTSGTGSVLSNYTYAYDLADRVTAKTEDGTTTSYGYDLASQLTQDGTATFGYDGTGNRTNSGYATGSGNRTTSDGAWAYTYDAAGNVTKKSKGASSDTWVYTYDNNDQMLTAAESATDGGAVTSRVTYAYDAFGNRVQRQGWDGTTATTERYALDGWDTAQPQAIGNENFTAWADLDGSNALSVRRADGPNFGDEVARVSSAGAVGWYLTDNQGSVRKVIDNSDTVLASVSYSAFGQVAAGSLYDGMGYTGVRRDPLTGLYSPGNGTREYAPDSGKFYQADPLFPATGANPFAYVRNRPTGYSDPSGLAGVTLDPADPPAQPAQPPGGGGVPAGQPQNPPDAPLVDVAALIQNAAGGKPTRKPPPAGGIPVTATSPPIPQRVLDEIAVMSQLDFGKIRQQVQQSGIPLATAHTLSAQEEDFLAFMASLPPPSASWLSADVFFGNPLVQFYGSFMIGVLTSPGAFINIFGDIARLGETPPPRPLGPDGFPLPKPDPDPATLGFALGQSLGTGAILGAGISGLIRIGGWGLSRLGLLPETPVEPVIPKPPAPGGGGGIPATPESIPAGVVTPEPGPPVPHPVAPAPEVAPGAVPRVPLTIRERLAEYYNRLRGQPPAKTADEALGRVRNTLDEVEDLHSGVPKRNPPPPPGQSDGRMYPPLDDFVTRNPNGSITARTRGHHIEIGSDGSITIKNLKTGDIEFQQPGGAGK